MSWGRKLFVTAMIFGLGMVSGFVFSSVADPFTRYMLPVIGAMAALWLFDVFVEGALRMRNSA